nr:immunoglobulin heavy chain junction region [Macaca mulatta]MOW46546.1 immunoglobulin heavy chain junction region [Macaca mulatta]MOW47547.1 immunoglobulin heavy chain junction region [Macaca mulatta]MOW49916.1 immunoglobulin heavy chain junction region [Macaca mulatta]MOW50284.1 immunoglobulin heavy chain junction region [Macaca mulatta]
CARGDQYETIDSDLYGLDPW